MASKKRKSKTQAPTRNARTRARAKGGKTKPPTTGVPTTPRAQTKLTAELQRAIELSVAGGLPVPLACQANGLSWNTAKDWLKKGKAGRQPYKEFRDTLRAAKAVWAGTQTHRITSASLKDWRAGAWLLERRLPEQFGRRQKVEHSGEVKLPEQADLSSYTTEELKTMRAIQASATERAKANDGGSDDDG